jgi:hypothetical protein
VDVRHPDLSRLASVSIDLDGVRHYRAIHGLPPAAGADPLLGDGLPRFLDLCDQLSVRATLFVVTADLADPALAELLRQAHAAGHELASHSHVHDYGMSRWAPTRLGADLGDSVAALEALTGVAPKGFRAPGYNLSEPLLDALEAAGMAYDASLLPSPAYWGARSLMIGLKAVGRKPSASLVGKLAAFRPQRGPFRVRRKSRPKTKVYRNLIELPMTAPYGVPWIGTTVVGSERMGGRLTHAAMKAKKPIDLELHPIDCTDGASVAADLLAARRDLQVPLALRMERLKKTLLRMMNERQVVTLSAVAERFNTPT